VTSWLASKWWRRWRPVSSCHLPARRGRGVFAARCEAQLDLLKLDNTFPAARWSPSHSRCFSPSPAGGRLPVQPPPGEPVPRPPQPRLDRTLPHFRPAPPRLLLRGVQLPLRDREDDSALVDLGNLIRVRIEVSSGKRVGVDDQTLEYAPTSITCSATPIRRP
jgi:hypothetical protein